MTQISPPYPSTESREDSLAASVLELTDAERDQVREIAAGLATAAGGALDAPGWLAAARAASEALPTILRRRLREFRHDAGPDGLLLVRNLPVEHDLPETPVRAGSVRRTASVAAGTIVTVMLQLGEVIAYRQEKSGALVQDVVPVPGLEKQQSNAGSVDLNMHTENAYHANRPHFVGLMCVRADPTGDARLRTAGIRRALPLLSASSRRVLSEELYITEPPPSFGEVDYSAPNHAVLHGAADDPDLMVDFSATHAVGEEARRALAELREALHGQAHAHALRPGELGILDNRLTVHGRTSFNPRFDGTDRWLHRVYAVLDGRRIRPDSVDGGAVLR